MKTWTRVLMAAAIASLVPALALAQVQPPDETLTATDIYREVFGVDPSSLAAMLSGNAPPTVIATVSRVVNVAALTAAVFIVVMTFLVGVAQTAHEGNVMGRRYNSMWVPIRTVFGLGLLAPLPGGYSAIQILVLWLGFVGSNLAEQAWENSLDFVQTQSTFSTATPAPAVRETVAAMLASQVCTARINTVSSQGGAMGPATVEGATSIRTVDGWFSNSEVGTVSFNGVSGGVNATGVCGQFIVERTTSGGGAADPELISAREQTAGLVALARATAPLAQQIASGSISALEVRSRLREVEGLYAAAERERARRYLGLAGQGAVALRTQQIERATESGWLMAGAWYMTLAGLNAEVGEELGQAVTIEPPRLEQLPTSLREDVEPYIQRTASITQPGAADSATQSAEAPSGSFNPLEALSSKISEIGSGIFFTLVDALANGNDPVVVLSSAGHTGLSYMAGTLAVGAVVGVKAGLLSLAILPLLPAILGILGAVGALMLMLGALAYYLPMIPFLIWIMGVAAWVVMLIEKIVVAPLWAAAHTMPDGDGFAGQHARQGYMILIGLVARPVLMVAGLVAAMLMVVVMAKIVGVGFKFVAGAASGDRQFGLFALVAYTGLFVAAILVFTRFAFSLISVIPDRALRWLGGGIESLGDANADQRVSGMGKGILVGAGGGMVAAGRATGQLAEAWRRRKDSGASVAPRP